MENTMVENEKKRSSMSSNFKGIKFTIIEETSNWNEFCTPVRLSLFIIVKIDKLAPWSSSLMQVWGGNWLRYKSLEWFVGFCGDAPSCWALYWAWAVLGGCDLLDMVCKVCLSFCRILLWLSNESDNNNETRGVAGQEEWKWLGHSPHMVVPGEGFVFSDGYVRWWVTIQIVKMFSDGVGIVFPCFWSWGRTVQLSAPTLSIRSLLRGVGRKQQRIKTSRST